jgi:hypothetical protein
MAREIFQKGVTMREILFKARRVSDGVWIFGDHVESNGDHYITNEPCLNRTDCGDYFEKVHPETVCQYIGLDDTHGGKIFEGDHVRSESLEKIRVLDGKIVPGISWQITEIGFFEGSRISRTLVTSSDPSDSIGVKLYHICPEVARTYYTLTGENSRDAVPS